MKCEKIRLSRHALQRMFERAISPEDVRSVVTAGAVIERYPDDTPYPSELLLGWVGSRPVHAVVAHDPDTNECYVVTAYEPDAGLWNKDFMSRRQP